MLARRCLPCLLLLAPACQAQCEVDAQSKVEVGADRLPDVDVKVDPDVRIEREVGVEVEVEPTVCDALDFEVVKIVLVPANPPFHDRPLERVSLRITNHGAAAVKLGSGNRAVFLDERRTVVDADMFQSEWFMPRTLPGKAAVIVDIVVPEGAGKALRTVEAEAEPEDQPFAECKVVDDLRSARAPAEPPPPAVEPPAEPTEPPAEPKPPAEAIDL